MSKYISLMLYTLFLSGFFAVQTVSSAEGWATVSTAKPACTNTTPVRYVNCGDGTVADNHTGLLWLRDAGCVYRTPTWEDWDIATIEVQNLADGNCGLSDGSQPGDWRLPTQQEWEEMVAQALVLNCTGPALTNDSGTQCYSPGAGSSFTNVCSSQEFCGYWSATTDNADRTKAFFLLPWGGDVSNSTAKSGIFNVWPVRYSQ